MGRLDEDLEDEWSSKPKLFKTGMFFPGWEANHGSLSHMPGLTNLKRLVTHGQVPWSMINLPKLETLEVTILNHLSWSIEASGGFINRPVDTSNTTITTLIVNMDIKILVRDAGMTYIRNLLPYLHTLQNLFIRLSTEDFDSLDYDFRYEDINDFHRQAEGNSYGCITDQLARESLETFILDTSRVSGEFWDSLDSDGQQIVPFMRTLPPPRFISGFPNLLRIMAPQEFYFSVDEDFNTLHLPASIGSIAIVDSTYAADPWGSTSWRNEGKRDSLMSRKWCCQAITRNTLL
jgi:hypothetical protein